MIELPNTLKPDNLKGLGRKQKQFLHYLFQKTSIEKTGLYGHGLRSVILIAEKYYKQEYIDILNSLSERKILFYNTDKQNNFIVIFNKDLIDYWKLHYGE